MLNGFIVISIFEVKGELVGTMQEIVNSNDRLLYVIVGGIFIRQKVRAVSAFTISLRA
jgi:hypothetical protein